jgi:hypothetical protein
MAQFAANDCVGTVVAIQANAMLFSELLEGMR